MPSATSLEEVLKLYLATKLLGDPTNTETGGGNAESGLADIRALLGGEGASSGSDRSSGDGGSSGGQTSSSPQDQTASGGNKASSRDILDRLLNLTGAERSSASSVVSGETSSPSSKKASQSTQEGSQTQDGGQNAPSGEVVQFLASLMKRNTTGQGSDMVSTKDASGSGAQGVAATEALLIAKAKEEFTHALQANLNRLRDVIQESQEIVRKMELVLGQSEGQGGGKGTTGSEGRSQGSQGGSQGSDGSGGGSSGKGS